MIRCNFSKNNAFRCLQSCRRLYSTVNVNNGDSIATTATDTSVENHKDESIDTQEALGEPTPTITDTQPFRKRDLPTSPLMDETWLANRNKFRTGKAAPSKEPTPLQRKLLRNPYAQALATPVRTCSITAIRLPSYFLRDFELIAHPETKQVFYLPRSLASKSSRPAEPTPKEEEEEEGNDSNYIPDVDDSPDTLAQTQAKPPTDLPENTNKYGPKAYLLSRKQLLGCVMDRRSVHFGAWQKSFPTRRMKVTRNFKRSEIGWRTDMEAFVTELMRRRTIEDLRYIGTRGSGYLSRCKSFEEVEKKKGVGAILWLPRKENIGMGKGPGEFATLDIKQKKIAVHNLEALLGEEKCAEIRKSMEVFEDEIVVVKTKSNTSRLLLRLWTLQGHLAEFEGWEPAVHHSGKKAFGEPKSTNSLLVRSTYGTMPAIDPELRTKIILMQRV